VIGDSVLSPHFHMRQVIVVPNCSSLRWTRSTDHMMRDRTDFVEERKPLMRMSLNLEIEVVAAYCGSPLRDAHYWEDEDRGRTLMAVIVHVVSDQSAGFDDLLSLLGSGFECLAVALQDSVRRNIRDRSGRRRSYCDAPSAQALGSPPP